MGRALDQDEALRGHRKRLRERFASSGLKAFQDHEVLELLLTYAIPRKDVKPIAKNLLNHFKYLASVFNAPRETLEAIKGVGFSASILIAMMPQLFERYRLDLQRDKKVLSSPKDVWDYILPRVDKSYESLWMIALDSQNRVTGCEMLQQGTVNRTVVIPRSVVETAIRYNATGVILVHNHPGGNVEPSRADIEITKLLKKTFEVIDIRLLDHIVVTSSSYFSFADAGELN